MWTINIQGRNHSMVGFLLHFILDSFYRFILHISRFSINILAWNLFFYIYSLILKVVNMPMLRLTSMLKLNNLMVLKNTMQSNMDYRWNTISQDILRWKWCIQFLVWCNLFCIVICDSLSFSFIVMKWIVPF